MTTQRLQIREECYAFDKYGLPDGSIMDSREIKRFLCDKNSYVDIKKTLVAAYKQENNETQCERYYNHYAFVDVIWRDTEQGRDLKTSLTEANGEEVAIKASECVTLFVKIISKDINLYTNSRFSMTTYYYKNIQDNDYINEQFETFLGTSMTILTNNDDYDLPGPTPMYRSMRVERILDKGNADLDEEIW